jgi:hypothetical protein
MLRRERLHPVEREKELEIQRLLGPERAVVVERRDTLVRGNEVRRAFLRPFFDKSDDGFLWSAVIPRWSGSSAARAWEIVPNNTMATAIISAGSFLVFISIIETPSFQLDLAIA